MDNDSKICGICGAGFREVDAKGRCVSCAKNYPDATNLDEVRSEKKGLDLYLNKEQIITLIEEKIESMVLVKTCEACGKKYIPSSPAQKKCFKCRAADAE